MPRSRLPKIDTLKAFGLYVNGHTLEEIADHIGQSIFATRRRVRLGFLACQHLKRWENCRGMSEGQMWRIKGSRPS
jgi:hypothetical protein